MTGGKIDAQMTCGAGKIPEHLTMTGTYTPERYGIRTIMAPATGAGGKGMTMAMHVGARGGVRCGLGASEIAASRQ